MNDYFSRKGRDQAVLQLGKSLDRAIDEFAEEHEALLRAACELPDELERVRTPAVLSFLGHCLWRIYDTRGRAEAELAVKRTLDDLDRATARGGKDEGVAPTGEKLDA